MEDKSNELMYDFLKQFEPKDKKSILGKVINKIRKRDDKAKEKQMKLNAAAADEP
jgi:hypothetical protein